MHFNFATEIYIPIHMIIFGKKFPVALVGIDEHIKFN